jgi:hypothetical protein
MVVAGLVSGPYRPNPFDVDDPLPCRCTPAEAAAALAGLWWWVAAGAVLVLAGVAGSVATRATTASVPPPWPLPAPVHALLAAVTGTVLAPFLGSGVLLALFMSTHLLPAGLAAGWLVQAAAVAGLATTCGPARTTPRRQLLTALVVSAVAGAATAAYFLWISIGVGWWLAAVHGVALGLAVLMSRVLPAPRPAPTPAGG